jgi:hypothetical protein
MREMGSIIKACAVSDPDARQIGAGQESRSFSEPALQLVLSNGQARSFPKSPRHVDWMDENTGREALYAMTILTFIFQDGSGFLDPGQPLLAGWSLSYPVVQKNNLLCKICLLLRERMEQSVQGRKRARRIGMNLIRQPPFHIQLPRPLFFEFNVKTNAPCIEKMISMGVQ